MPQHLPMTRLTVDGVTTMEAVPYKLPLLNAHATIYSAAYIPGGGREI